MKANVRRTIAQYVGLGLAVFIPALVIAQPLPSFAPNQVLTASQLQTMSDAIAETRRQLELLQNDTAVVLSKAAIYSRQTESSPIQQNIDGIAQARCDAVDDILLNCGCQGLLGTANSLQLDLRRVTTSNAPGAASVCTCQGVNVGSNEPRTIRAIAECLPVR